MGTVLDALRALGARVDGDRAAVHPARHRARCAGGEVVIDASASSQFVSGLLLSGARYDKGVDVHHDGQPVPSLPHIEMTVEMLRAAGVEVDDATPNTWRVAPGPIAARDWAVEPDLSNAAVFLAAAAVTGGEVTVRRLAARLHPAGHARSCPCWPRPAARSPPAPDGMTVTGPAELAGVDVDLRDASELTPTVAALAALAAGPSRLRGVAHIRGHETDRLAALATELTALGGDVTETPDGLEIRPAPLRARPDRPWRAYADHRMATAGAIIGLVVPGVAVDDIGCTDKTIPDFPARWAALLGWRRSVTGTPVRRASTTSPTSGSGPGAGARGRAPSAAPSTPTPRRRWSPRSTAAAGPAPRTATRPAAGHRDAGPRAGPHADRRRRPGRPGRRPLRRRRTRSPGSSASSRARHACCAAPPTTTDPYERVVVANAEQLVIVTALADPPPRTGFVDRCLVAAYAGGLAPGALPDQGRPGRPGAVRRALPPSWTCRCVVTRRDRRARRAARACSPGGSRRWSGTRAWASRRWSTRWCRTRSGPSAWCRRSARAGTPPTAALALPLPAERGGGWVVDTPGIRSFGLAHVTPDDVPAAFDDLADGDRGLPARLRAPRPARRPGVRAGHAGRDGPAAARRLAALRRVLVALTSIARPARAAPMRGRRRIGGSVSPAVAGCRA